MQNSPIIPFLTPLALIDLIRDRKTAIVASARRYREEAGSPPHHVENVPNAPNFMSVMNATRHVDDGMGWAVVTPLHVAGHILHTKSHSHLLAVGETVAFDSRMVHWTKGGTDILVFAVVDMKDQPTQEQVTARLRKLAEMQP